MWLRRRQGLIDFDAPPVELDAGFLETEVVDVRFAASCDQQRLRFQLPLLSVFILDGRDNELALLFEARRFCAGEDLDAFFREALGDERARVGVVAR